MNGCLLPVLLSLLIVISGKGVHAQDGNVEKSYQRRSRHFPVLTYSVYAPRAKIAAALLDRLF